MTTYTLNEIASGAYALFDTMTDATSGNLATFADQSRIRLQNYVGNGIDNTSIPETYANILINMTAVKAIKRDLDINAGNQFRIGDFSDGGGEDPEIARMNSLQEDIEEEMRNLPRSLNFAKVLG